MRSDGLLMALAVLMMLLILSSCGKSPAASEAGALDVLEPEARRCAGALLGDDMVAARAGCTPLIEGVIAGARAGRGE